MDTLPSRLLLSFGFIVLIAIMRSVEVSFDIVGEARIKARRDSGSSRAKRFLKLAKKPARVNTCTNLATMTLTIILSAYSVYAYAPYFEFESTILKCAVIIIGVCAAITVFGIGLPTRIAAKNPEKALFSFAWIFFVLYYIFLPFSLLFSLLADLLSTLFGIKPGEQNDEVTEEEIRLMVDMGSENGAIDPDEKEMIHNIFELDDTPVENVMTHRTDVDFLWLEDLDDWEESMYESNHSVYPVCGESVDDIVGILHSRDFLHLLRKNGNATLESTKEILRQPYFVPESIKANDLFKNMQENKTHFAVVLDEYGGLSGIVSMSDLLEEIVGDLDNEYDEDNDEKIVKIGENTWKIRGSADIDEVSDALGVELPTDEYNTFAGMILTILGSIPEDGTTAELQAYNLDIKLTKIEEHRIEETIVKLIEPENTDDDKD